ncbi:hypothetical protein JOD24_001548 [Kroppenstedtia sanguinis]
MTQMNQMKQMVAGQGQMNESLISVDMLLAAKNGVRNTAFALTEASTPEVREMLKRQLQDCINHHEQVYAYMEQKGWYNAKDFSKQVQVDQQMAQQAQQMVHPSPQP